MMKNKKMIRLLFLMIISLIVFQIQASAQTTAKEIRSQSQGWFSINSTIRLSKKFGVMADLHERRNNFIADPSFHFVRLGANYWIKDNIILTAGYAQLWLAPAKQDWHHYALEKRVYQQIQISTKIGKIGLLNRLRNEQRWQEKIVNDKFIHDYKFTDRVRYLLSMTIPVFKNPHFPSVVLSDELAIQFGKEVVYNTFDQNRLFVGIKQPVCKALSFDLGYMLLYQQKATGYQYDKNHTFRWFFYYTPDFRQKKKETP
jgi:hypothetical protein